MSCSTFCDESLTPNFVTELDICKEQNILYSRESAPMGIAPYMLAEQGGGRSFKCFRKQPQKSAHLNYVHHQAQLAASSKRVCVSTSTSLESLATSHRLHCHEVHQGPGAVI